MKPKYTKAFIEQAVVKLLGRGNRTVKDLALQLNVSHSVARNWIARRKPAIMGGHEGGFCFGKGTVREIKKDVESKKAPLDGLDMMVLTNNGWVSQLGAGFFSWQHSNQTQCSQHHGSHSETTRPPLAATSIREKPVI
jgi:hypothetical protein